MNLHRDERGLLTAYVVRIIIVFALLLAGVEEVGQIIWAEVRVSNAAGVAAQAAADTYAANKNYALAKKAAIDAAAQEEPSAQVQSVEIATDGSVTVVAVITAKTIIVKRVGFLQRFGVEHSTEEAVHSLA
jgi:Flp pilus assembly protein TadG